MHASADAGTTAPHAPAAPADALRAWLRQHRRVFVLTGAGVSTDSGIPDYRDADGRWKRAQPVTWQAFLDEPATRTRYWARSFAGWPAVANAMPNDAHRALATLEARGRLAGLVTQNVDGLHERAGQRTLVDLHGRIDRVQCLACGLRLARAEVQRWLAGANPEWSGLDAPVAPDGDADLEGRDFTAFRVPPCPRCGGMLKPDVVFFGENVPRERVAAAQALLDAADAMLVAGSSLMVYSGFRFARLARDRGLPLALLGRGLTRADGIATLKLDAGCGETLAAAVAALD